MYRAYIESQLREMMGGTNHPVVSARNNLEIMWEYLLGSYSFLSTFWMPRIELPDMSTLGYSYVGWLSTNKEQKQEIIRKIRNLENRIESETTELDNIDMENPDEMNRIFENIINKKQDPNMNFDDDSTEYNSGGTDGIYKTEIIIKIEDYEKDSINCEMRDLDYQKTQEEENSLKERNFEVEDVERRESEEFINDDKWNLENQVDNIKRIETDQDYNDVKLSPTLEETSHKDIAVPMKGDQPEILIEIDDTAEESQEENEEEEFDESSPGDRRERCNSNTSSLSLSLVGKLSRSNSLLALNEALIDAGKAIESMDNNDKEALDEVTFDETQVEAIKFLAVVASKK